MEANCAAMRSVSAGTGWTPSLIFVVLFCALVDFVKLLVELLLLALLLYG